MTNGYYCAIFSFCGGGKKKDNKKTKAFYDWATTGILVIRDRAEGEAWGGGGGGGGGPPPPPPPPPLICKNKNKLNKKQFNKKNFLHAFFFSPPLCAVPGNYRSKPFL